VAGFEDVTSTSFSARLAYDASAAAMARRLVSELLSRCHVSDELIGDATLVIHELVVNGLTHGAPDEHDRIEVSGRIADTELILSVLDHGTRGTVAAEPFTDHRTHGRGLSMVDVLSSSWTVDRSAGTRVSARLALWRASAQTSS
jgi:anti-sigma regulatory factor (Ser/Thr protein kinase)